MGGGSFTTPVAGTAQDIRFTRSKDNTVLYATALGWQGGTMTIQTLNSTQFDISTLVSAQLLDNAAGTYINLPAPTQDASGLHLTMPSSTAPFASLAYVVKLTFAGQIPVGAGPVFAGWVKLANATSGLVLDSGGSVPSGAALKQWSWGGSSNLQSLLVGLGKGYYRIANDANDMVADSWGNTANGATCLQAAWSSGNNNQQWTFKQLSSGAYQIINRGTGTALDDGGAPSQGSVTKLWAPNASPNNQWTVSNA